MKVIYAIAAILVAVVNVESGRVARQGPPEKDCEDCERQMDSCLIDMGPEIEKTEPVSMTPPQPCIACNITKLCTVKRAGAICSEKTQDGGWKQDMHLGFDSIHCACDCLFKDKGGQDAPVKMVIEWKEAIVQTILQINDGKCKVLSGSVDCEGNDGKKKCEIPKENTNIECQADDDTARENCEAAKEDTGSKILQSVAETSFPAVATEKVNESPSMVDKMTCEDDA